MSGENNTQNHNKKNDSKKAADKKDNSLGVTVTKEEDFSEWYTQLMVKAEFADYTDVSGCIVFRPRSYDIWDTIRNFIDGKIRKMGVRNAYFPLFIPKSYFEKEAEHVAGFTPEVAWVTHAGTSELTEHLAIRPTSETIMYASYKNWITSHRDLPLRLNQWANVVRWEFKHAVPFLRTREFLWQEGHTVFATREEADKEVMEILDLYAEVYEDLLAVPMIKGTKSEKEKFAGALYTMSVESFLPNGKAIQGATSHCLGQNFSKAFDIKFTDADEKEKYPWQNSWGFTTRSIGVMLMMHGDDKGAVIPPRVSMTKAVIVPILFDKTKEMVIKSANELKDELESAGFEVFIDDREEHSPGFKYNEWELKGVPMRIEIGPKDIEKGHVVMVRRDNGEKNFVKRDDAAKELEAGLEAMQKSMFEKAKAFIDSQIVDVEDMDGFKKAIDEKKMVRAYWCGEPACEEIIKDVSGGAKSLNMPLDQPGGKKKCVQCDKECEKVAYFAKSY